MCFCRGCCGGGKEQTVLHRKEALGGINLKNKTYFWETFLWVYIIINSVSAGVDIYSYIEFCQYGRILFPEFMLYPLYVIFHVFFGVDLRKI